MGNAIPRWRVLRVRTAALLLLLSLATLASYWPLTRNGFVTLDDTQYLICNLHVASGLSWRGLLWALQANYGCNWHPLTWLSHMLDCQLFGLNPLGHHLMSLALHVLVTLLLFQFLHRATQSLWRSVTVAAFFALHPLHVESVVWASERKDVLSALFFLLCLIAYVSYVKQKVETEPGVQSLESKVRNSNPASSFYVLSLVLFALGLMSKPMVVTLPFVLLLLDFWPLQRTGSTLSQLMLNARRLLLEKIPFFLLSIGASIATYAAQNYGGAVQSFHDHPLASRIANVFVSYARYLSKTFWPVNLTVVYPYQQHWPVLSIIISMLVVTAVSTFACIRTRRFPYYFTGWFWFVGMLVPVIGLVQVGREAMAERYMYLPSIGLFVVIIWGAHDALLALKRKLQTLTAALSFPARIAPNAVISSAVLPALAVCGIATFAQTKTWRTSETLFGRAVTLFPHNADSLSGMGGALAASGHNQEALPLLTEAVHLDPTLADAQYNFAAVLMNLGRVDEAVAPLKTLVKSLPRRTDIQMNLGCAYFRLGKMPEAEACFSKAAALEPENPMAHYNSGMALMAQSKIEPALAELSAAVRLDPSFVIKTAGLSPRDPALHYYIGTTLLMQSHENEGIAELLDAVRLDPNLREAHRNLGIAFQKRGENENAIRHFAKVVRISPESIDSHVNLAIAFLDGNHVSEALRELEAALVLAPNDANVHYRLGVAQARIHQPEQAIAHYREALRLSPQFPEAQHELAALLNR